MDQWVLISIVSALAAIAAFFGTIGWDSFSLLVTVAFFVGGMTNPLYSLLIAHNNDFLNFDDMFAASGGLLFIHGFGAISGPLIIGWIISQFSPLGFFLVINVLMGSLSLYALFRMTPRTAIAVEDTGAYAAVSPGASPVALGIAQEYAIDVASEDEEK